MHFALLVLEKQFDIVSKIKHITTVFKSISDIQK